MPTEAGGKDRRRNQGTYVRTDDRGDDRGWDDDAADSESSNDQ